MVQPWRRSGDMLITTMIFSQGPLRLASAEECFPVALYVSTPEGRLLDANRALARLLGYDEPSELLGVPLESVYVDPTDRRQWLARLVTEGMVHGFEVQLRRKDGSSIWVRNTSHAAHGPDPGSIVLQGVLEDITQERSFRDEAQESGLRLTGLFESARDAIFMIQDGRFVELNPAAIEMFAAADVDLRTHYPYELSPPTQPSGRGSQDLAWERIRAAEAGEPQFFEWQHRRLNGEVFDAEVSLNPVELAGELYLQAIVRDVTQRKELEASRKRRSDILDAVVYAAGRFLHEPSWESVVDDVLERLGQAASVSRAYLYRVDEPDRDPKGFLLAEWVAPGVSSTFAEKALVDSQQEGVYRWLRPLLAGTDIVGRAEEFSEDVQDFLARTDVRSLALVPVIVEGTVWGAVGFDHCDDEAVWSEGEVEALRAAAEILGAAIRLGNVHQRLEVSENEFRDLFENVEDVICVLDLEGRFVSINAAATRVLGYRREEIIGRQLVDVIPTRYHNRIEEYRRRMLAEGRAEGMATVRTPAGDERVLEFRNNLRVEGVEQPLVRAIGRDITDRWRAERDRERYAAQLEMLRVVDRAVLAGDDPRSIARAAVARLRDVVRCDRVSVYLFDRDQHAAELVAVAEESTGSLGMAVGEVIPLESAHDPLRFCSTGVHVVTDLAGLSDPPPVVREMLAAGVQSVVVVRLEAEQRVYGTLNLVSQRRGELDESAADIARQLGEELSVALFHAELRAAVAAEKERFQALLQHLPEGVLLLDGQHRILVTNRAGWDALEALGHHRASHSIETLGGEEMAELVVRQGEGDVELGAVDGSGRFFELRSAGVGGEAGGEWALVVRDVTEARQVERKLQLQDRLAAVGQLAAGIAHDFNNILQAVQLNAELLVVDHGIPEPTANLDAVREQVRRGSVLVRQILDFARKTVTRPEPMLLAPFLEDAFQLLASAIPESIDVDLELLDPDVTVTADIAQMQQVITNLAVNAADAMPDGGQLRVCLREISVSQAHAPFPEMAPGRWVELSVEDSGTGIPEELRERVFEPFVTTKEAGRGTGLGLSQVYGIVTQHGGFVDLESTVGEGTRFRVLLPAANGVDAAQRSRRREQPARRGGGQCVLVVEDDPSLLQLIKKSLLTLGYCVETAVDGVHALELYQKIGSELALVISDVVMPRMGGVELIERIQRSEVVPKFLLITGHPLNEFLSQAGDVRCLTKPFTVHQLAEAVAEALDDV